MPADSALWFEAKFHQIETIAQTDPARAKRIWDQFKALHPGARSWLVAGPVPGARPPIALNTLLEETMARNIERARATKAKPTRPYQIGLRSLIALVACCAAIIWAGRVAWQNRNPDLAGAR